MTPLQQNISLVVQRLDRATDISSSSGLPYKCLVFPTSGGVQAIDAAGTVLPLVGATGSLIPSADNVDALGSAALRWSAGYFGTSVQTPLLNTSVGGLATSVMALAAAASAVNIVTVTSADIGNTPSIAATGNDTNISLTLDTKGTGSLLLTAPAQINPPAAASGVQTALTVNAANNGAVTAVTEQIDVEFDLNRIVTWAAGAGTLALQRAFSVAAPTYDSVNGAVLTITRAATFYVSGAPSGGADIVLNNSYAILVDSGTVHFDDQLSLGGNVSLSGGAPTITATTADQGITLIPSGIGAVALQGSGGANIVAVDTTGGVSRLGFFNVTPLIRQTVNDCVVAADGTSAGTQLNALLASLRLFGLLT